MEIDRARDLSEEDEVGWGGQIFGRTRDYYEGMAMAFATAIVVGMGVAIGVMFTRRAKAAAAPAETPAATPPPPPVAGYPGFGVPFWPMPMFPGIPGIFPGVPGYPPTTVPVAAPPPRPQAVEHAVADPYLSEDDHEHDDRPVTVDVQPPAEQRAIAARRGGSTLKTFVLPWLGNPQSKAIRIATAGPAEPYDAYVRTVGPPGALAVLSFDATELNTSSVTVLGPGLSSVPAGDVMIVPAGQNQLVRFRPNQALYAKGNLGSPQQAVTVSITSADFVVGLNP